MNTFGKNNYNDLTYFYQYLYTLRKGKTDYLEEFRLRDDFLGAHVDHFAKRKWYRPLKFFGRWYYALAVKWESIEYTYFKWFQENSTSPIAEYFIRVPFFKFCVFLDEYLRIFTLAIWIKRK